MLTGLPGPVPYREPFDSGDFAQRMALLRRGRMRVAYYYDYPDSSTFRYRVYNMIQVLDACDPQRQHDRPDMSASWFCAADGARLPEVAEVADILVICRARYTNRINELATRAKNLGKTVLFDCDDLVFDPKYVHLLVRTLDQDLSQEAVWDHWFGYIGRISATMRLCDGAIVTNAFLAQLAQKTLGKPVYILPNFLNFEQIKYSDTVRDSKFVSGFKNDGRIHIGYFSGSPTHNKDFAIAVDAIAALMRDDRRIHLRIGGYLDVTSQLESFGSRIERFPMQDYVNLQKLIGSTELNIAPLQDNVFTNCKSELKYFEAAIVGTPTIASPTYLFRKAINDGENGWLAQPHEWAEKIANVIQAFDGTRESYAAVAKTGYAHSVAAFSGERFYKDIVDVLMQRAAPSDGTL